MLIGEEAEITPKFESCSLDCHVSYTLHERYRRARPNIIVSRAAAAQQQQQQQQQAADWVVKAL